jgi:adenylate cyclase
MISTSTRKRLTAIALGLIITVLHLGWLISDQPLLADVRQRLDNLIYDLRLNATLPQHSTPHPQIVVVDIDERSLSEQGRWPWHRTKLAELIEALHAQGVAVSALDIVLSEAQSSPARQVREFLAAAPGTLPQTLQQLAWADTQLNGDRILSAALQDKDVVLGFILERSDTRKGVSGSPLRIAGTYSPNLAIATATGQIGNIPELQAATPFAGFFNIDSDNDGLVRRYNLLMRLDGQFYPSLALEAVRVFQLLDTVEFDTAPIGGTPVLESVQLGSYHIPTDETGRMIIPFRGSANDFERVSATDVMEGRVEPGKLINRIAFIGSTAKGLFDFRSTPVQASYPGVEIHATVAAAILDRSIPHRPLWADGANFVIVLAAGLTLALLLPFLGPLQGLLVALLSAGVLVWLNLWFWTEHALVLDLAVPLVMVIALAGSEMAYGYISESLTRRRLSSMFEQYVPPSLVDEMTRHPGEFGFEGERREMTVLFADVRDFTSISESLSPKQVKDLINLFLTPMTRIIFEQRGTIDKYIGDMIMAFWGAPLNDPDHARLALDAALHMLRQLEDMEGELQARGFPKLHIGIGINTGIMNVGNMGSEFRRAYTVLGDAVNLGSRLESLTKFYQVPLIVGEATRETLSDYLFRPLDRVRVKGKHQPVSIYQPLCLRDEAGDTLLSELSRYEQALQLYVSRDWAGAHQSFRALSEAHPDDPVYRLYLERTAGDVHNLSDDWDGVFNHG